MPLRGQMRRPMPTALFEATTQPRDVDDELQAACAEIAAIRRMLGVPPGSTIPTVVALEQRLASGGAAQR